MRGALSRHADRPLRPRAGVGLALCDWRRIYRADRARGDAVHAPACGDLLLRDDDHRQPDRRNGTCGKLYPARMRTSGLGWAIGIGRLGGIAAPVLGGYLLTLGMPPTHIFL